MFELCLVAGFILATIIGVVADTNAQLRKMQADHERRVREMNADFLRKVYTIHREERA